MGKFIHIYIRPNIGLTKQQLERKLDLAIDWYRYDDGLYVVYTTSSVEKWQQRLLHFVNTDGRLFICEFRIESKKGWMNKDFWDWIKLRRTK